MELVAVAGIPQLNTTPLATLRVESPEVVVELDDANETRFRLRFSPYQAIRMVTADCFVSPGGEAIMADTVMEVRGSAWLEELKASLRLVDEGAHFLDEAHHYLLPLQDDFLEIVAWSVEVITDQPPS